MFEFFTRSVEESLFALWSPNGFIKPNYEETESKFTYIYTDKPYLSGLSSVRTLRYRMMTRLNYEEVCQTRIVKMQVGMVEQVKRFPYPNSSMKDVYHCTGEIEARYENQPALDKALSYLKNAGFVNEHLFAIEQHWHTNPERTDRYFIVFGRRVNNTKLVETTGIIGNFKRFFFAPNKEALVLMKLFFDYPVERLYDFEEQRIVQQMFNI